MIALILALLALLFHGPAPTPHGVTVSPEAPAPASVVVRGGEPRTPGPHPGVVAPPAGSPGSGARAHTSGPPPAAAPTVSVCTDGTSPVGGACPGHGVADPGPFPYPPGARVIGPGDVARNADQGD